jgi:hypothetical protein
MGFEPQFETYGDESEHFLLPNKRTASKIHVLLKQAAVSRVLTRVRRETGKE